MLTDDAKINPEHTPKRLMFYYGILLNQFNKNTYGDCFFFPDNINIRIDKFLAWLYDNYHIRIKHISDPNDRFFSDWKEVVTFDSYEDEEKFFNEARAAELIHLLKE